MALKLRTSRAFDRIQTNVLKDICSSFNIFGGQISFGDDSDHRFKNIDTQSLYEDFEAVGEDMRAALGEYEKASKIKSK